MKIGKLNNVGKIFIRFEQPEFEGLECSIYNSTRDERAKLHGWMDANGGATGNLSDYVGDLSVLDQAIKNCLMDEEQ